MSKRVSVIIPTFNEESCISACLESLLKEVPLEVIIVDGGSTDRTIKIIEKFQNIKFTTCEKNRAKQLNHGALLAQGDLLWFLHADSEVCKGSLLKIEQALSDTKTLVGAFSFSLKSETTWARVIEFGVRLRSCVFNLPYGDQGYFISKEAFLKIGGFFEEEKLEDLEFWLRIRNKYKTILLEEKLTTSARKWEERGVIRNTLNNLYLLSSYLLSRV